MFTPNEYGLFSMPTLETPRLTLRRMTMKDAKDVFEYSRDADVARHVLWSAQKDIGEAKDYCRYMTRRYRADEPSSWGIVDKKTGRLVGTIGYMNYDMDNASVEIGYSLAKWMWNGGYMTEATGVYEADSPWHGKPTFQIKYDPDAARQLMTEAGYSASKPLHVTVATSASGSGQMQPLPMNEYIQQSLKSCFFNVDIKVVEWNTLFTNWRLGARDPSAKGIDAINVSAAVNDPYFGLIRFSTAKAFPPVATNWGYFSTPETEKLAAAVKHAFTPAEMNKAAGELHAALVDQVPFLFVAHDVGPRAISPAVTGVVQPQSWFIDLSLVSKKE